LKLENQGKGREKAGGGKITDVIGKTRPTKRETQGGDKKERPTMANQKIAGVPGKAEGI